MVRCHLLRKVLKQSRLRKRWNTSTLQTVKTAKMILKLISQNKKTMEKVIVSKRMTLNTVQTTFDHVKEQLRSKKQRMMSQKARYPIPTQMVARKVTRK